MDEQKVIISPNGLGRIAIIRRDDGRFVLFEHWRWSVEMQTAMRVEPVLNRGWTDDDYDRNALYERTEPLPGLYGTVEEAEREGRSRPGFANAVTEGES